MAHDLTSGLRTSAASETLRVADDATLGDALDAPTDQLGTILDSIPTLVWTARADGSADFFNRQWLEYTGLATEQALDWGWMSVLHPEDRDRVLEYWRSIRDSGQRREIDVRMRRADGEYRWFLIRANAVRDSAGNILKWCGANTEIEDRRREENLVRASEESFRLIVDTLPGLVFTTTAQGEVEFVNPALLAYFGRRLDELQAWKTSDSVHPDDLSNTYSKWQRGVESGEPYDFEQRLRRADGIYRWFHFRASPLRDAQGRITRWYGLLTEIDDLKRAQEAALTNERELRLLIDRIPGLVYTMTPTCELEMVNGQVLEYFGRTFDELKGWELIGCVHPEDMPRVLESLRRTVELGEPHEVEQRLRRADGTYRWFKPRALPLLESSGRILRWYCLLTDIDDLKRAEQAARSSEREMRLLVDSIPGMIATRTVAGEVEFVNRQLREYFGQALTEVQRWRTNDNIHPDDRARAVALWLKACETQMGYESEARLRRADGVYRWFNYRTVPSRDEHGRLIRWYCLINDVDDLKRAEEALRRTQARLTRATHLAALSEFAATIAHEINQPLAAVIANAHACSRWLTADTPNVERATRSAERIIRDGNATAEAVRRIRSLFKHVPFEKALLRMDDVIEEVCTLMADDLRTRAVMLEIRLSTAGGQVEADRVQLQQVLTNLVRNAIDAMDTVIDRPKLLAISSRQQGEEIIVEVADHGVGIGDTESLFDSFYTTKANGMGMGLAICRSIIEAHGGRMWATNNRTCGATFGFALNTAQRE